MRKHAVVLDISGLMAVLLIFTTTVFVLILIHYQSSQDSENKSSLETSVLAKVMGYKN